MAAAIAAFVWGGYYAFGILRSTAFNTDRAFRVLTQIVAQLDNFQGTMTSLLKLIPESSANCRPDAACKKEWRRYTDKLDVPDIELLRVSNGLTPRDDFRIMAACEDRGGPRNGTPTASLASRYELWLRLDDPGRRFALHACAAHADEPGIMQLHGKLQTGLPQFVSQTFFDEVLLTLQNGTVVTAIRDSDDVETTQVELHAASDQGLIVADASELLRAAAQADANSDSPASADGKTKAAAAPTPGAVAKHPVVFDKTIGGKKYRVFVLPFHPSVPWYVHGDSQGKDTAGGLQRQELLYIVGLKLERFSDQITYALWPDGTFVIAVLSLLVVLLWPLVHLRYSTPLEPVSQTTAYATGVSFLLIPGVLCICAIWSWSRVQLINWADAGAKQYAKDIESHLIGELRADIGLLQYYRDTVYAAYSGTPCKVTNSGPSSSEALAVPVRFEDLAAAGNSIVPEGPCETRYLSGNAIESSALGAWSPLRTVIGLGEEGDSFGPRLTAFGRPPPEDGGDDYKYVPQRLIFNVRDREYFRALRSGEGWKPRKRGPWETVPDRGFVAQRLFNRGDAARVLQIAVPRHGDQGEFAGAVIGDSRVYGLTATVSPLLLRFAVVDRDSGVVLFHTDDSRSLVENFVVETENDEELLGRLKRRVPGDGSRQPWLEEHFNGRYLSEPHRFHSRPVTGVPWNIVVFYPSKELLDVAFQAGVAALGVFVAIAAGAVLILLSIAYMRRGTGGRVVALLWPRWRWRTKYEALAWLGVGLLIGLAGYGPWALGYGWTGVVGALAGAGAMLRGLVIYRRSRSSDRAKPGVSVDAGVPDKKPGSSERQYVACLCACALLVSALPAAYLGLWFHDLSVQSFVRNGLFSAGQQIERRHATIAGDLRRWDPDGRSRRERYPAAWDLADQLLPVPGLKTARRPSRSCKGEIAVWTVTAFSEIPWANLSGPPGETSPLRLIWSVTRESAASQKRVRPSREVKAGQGENGDGSSAPGLNTAAGDKERERGSPNSDAKVEQGDKGNRSGERKTGPSGGKGEGALATQAQACNAAPEAPSEPYWQPEYDGHRTKLIMPYARSTSGESIPAALRYALTMVLAIVTLLIIGMLSLMVARRLFGSRNAFRWGARPERTVDRPEPKPGLDDFKATWKILSQEDQVFLHQLAQGRLVNPANEKSIKRLAQAGLIEFDPWPKIADDRFREYAQTAEKEEDFDAWELEASKSLWKSIRTPLLVVLLIVVGLLLWLSSSSMQIITTVLAGLASLVGYVTQTASVFRAAGGGKG
jgi:hypothetical protein